MFEVFKIMMDKDGNFVLLSKDEEIITLTSHTVNVISKYLNKTMQVGIEYDVNKETDKPRFR